MCGYNFHILMSKDSGLGLNMYKAFNSVWYIMFFYCLEIIGKYILGVVYICLNCIYYCRGMTRWQSVRGKKDRPGLTEVSQQRNHISFPNNYPNESQQL